MFNKELNAKYHVCVCLCCSVGFNHHPLSAYFANATETKDIGLSLRKIAE